MEAQKVEGTDPGTKSGSTSRRLSSPQDYSVKNATQRRARACRADIARGVLLLHDIFLKSLPAPATDAALDGCTPIEAVSVANPEAASTTGNEVTGISCCFEKATTTALPKRVTRSRVQPATNPANPDSASNPEAPTLSRPITTQQIRSRKRSRSSTAVPNVISEAEADDGIADDAPQVGATAASDSLPPQLFNVFDEREWHPLFDLDQVTVAEVQRTLEAARRSPLWTAGQPRALLPEPGD